MELLTADQRDALFDTLQQDAFHLELRDSYAVDSEDESYRRWKRGEPPDPSERDRPWLQRIKRITQRGRTVRRVRVVTEPISEYMRFEYDSTAENQLRERTSAGPRGLLPSGVVCPARRDWWLSTIRLSRSASSTSPTAPRIRSADPALVPPVH
jgi:hypothetical protein